MGTAKKEVGRSRQPRTFEDRIRFVEPQAEWVESEDAGRRLPMISAAVLALMQARICSPTACAGSHRREKRLSTCLTSLAGAPGSIVEEFHQLADNALGCGFLLVIRKRYRDSFLFRNQAEQSRHLLAGTHSQPLTQSSGFSSSIGPLIPGFRLAKRALHASNLDPQSSSTL